MRVAFLLALSVVATSGVMAQQKEVLKVPGAVEGLPFSSAIRVGKSLSLDRSETRRHPGL
jgi:hypothetical protein